MIKRHYILSILPVIHILRNNEAVAIETALMAVCFTGDFTGGRYSCMCLIIVVVVIGKLTASRGGKAGHIVVKKVFSHTQKNDCCVIRNLALKEYTGCNNNF